MHDLTIATNTGHSAKAAEDDTILKYHHVAHTRHMELASYRIWIYKENWGPNTPSLQLSSWLMRSPTCLYTSQTAWGIALSYICLVFSFTYLLYHCTFSSFALRMIVRASTYLWDLNHKEIGARRSSKTFDSLLERIGTDCCLYIYLFISIYLFLF